MTLQLQPRDTLTGVARKNGVDEGTVRQRSRGAGCSTGRFPATSRTGCPSREAAVAQADPS